MTIEHVQVWIRVVIGAVIGLWHVVPAVTQLLVLLMAADVVLGVTVAIRDHAFNVDYARRGAGKKLATLVMVGVAAVLTPYVQDFVGINLVQAASAFYLVPELGSVTKNAALLGAPTFPAMTMVLDYFDTFSKASSKTTAVVSVQIASDNQKLSADNSSKEQDIVAVTRARTREQE